MMVKGIILPRLLFALTALLVCVLISFRPVPSIYHENDTGRYIESLHLYCAGINDDRVVGKEVSYSFFYGATSAACLFESDSIFMFEVALFVPLIFLLFARWREGTFVWACSLLFSMFGLELMINAMRQGFAMLLLFGAIMLMERHRYLAFFLGILAATAHSSVLYYTPFLFWLAGVRFSKRIMRLVGGSALILALIFINPIINFVQSGDDFEFFTEIYADKSNTYFILFISLPLFWIYGVRYFFEKEYISEPEKSGVLYSFVLMLICSIFFPAVIYRFAIFAVVMQIFLIVRSEKSSVKVGGYVFIGMFLHFLVMVFFSKKYLVLING
jgi:EpsG family